MSRELNLLPPIRRRMLDRQLILAVLNRFMAALIFSCVLLTGVGVASIAVLQGLIMTSSSSVEIDLVNNIDKYQRVREEIAVKNEVIQAMYALNQGRVIWSDFFQDIFAILPPNMTIERMSGTAADNRRLEFSGVALTRSSLIVLEDRLDELMWVDRVIAPRSNLIQRENPKFRFDLILKESNQEAVDDIEDDAETDV